LILRRSVPLADFDTFRAMPAPRPLLLSCESISKQFGVRPLFENLTFGLSEGDRVGLVGPNGSGKSTLLKILAGLEEPDSGSRSVRKGIRAGYVPQAPVFPPEMSVEAVLIEALAGEPLEEFEKSGRAVLVLGRLGFGDPAQTVGTLSGGWNKRLAVARELVREPDILLLDEPTNHLDLEGILELEEILASEARAYVVVSHDRYFMENVARRMRLPGRISTPSKTGRPSNVLARAARHQHNFLRV
jgi:ATP-binding cassette subfamily F protein uup